MANSSGDVSTNTVVQCFSTGIPRNPAVPREAAKDSAETDRNCLGRNWQPQFYAVIAIYTPGSFHRVPRARQTFGKVPLQQKG